MLIPTTIPAEDLLPDTRFAQQWLWEQQNPPTCTHVLMYKPHYSGIGSNLHMAVLALLMVRVQGQGQGQGQRAEVRSPSVGLSNC